MSGLNFGRAAREACRGRLTAIDAGKTGPQCPAVSSVPFFMIFFVAVVVFAVLRGGGAERATAGAYTAALAGSAYFGFLRVPGNFRVVPLGLFLVDFLLLVALCAIAVRANRWWIIPAAGCQLVAVLVHTGKLLDPNMVPRSYEFLTDVWSWPMVALLAIGTWAHRRRLKQGIIVPDWKPSSDRRLWTIRGRRQSG
jgi:hypothetical protein